MTTSKENDFTFPDRSKNEVSKLKEFVPPKEVLHTQGEWEIWESSTSDPKGHHLYISVPYKGIVCRMNDITDTHISKTDLANAELICKAVNAYIMIFKTEEKMKAIINERQRLIDSNRELVEALRGLHEATCEVEDYNVKLTHGFIDSIITANKKAQTAINNTKAILPQ